MTPAPPHPEALTTPQPGSMAPDLPPTASTPALPSASIASIASDATPSQPLSPAGRAAVDTELEQVEMAVRSFRTELGENPIGTNAEITRSLLGDNLKQVKIPVPPGSQLNGKGELCDRWGTPYFFHQVSHDRMEIRSAGPDRQMWTDDDFEVK